jgi:murein DD-endopeptidase MepM/ murein hydrolase activator NlpD
MDESQKESDIESNINNIGLEKAFMTYNQSNVNQKNFVFAENAGDVNVFDLLSKYSNKYDDNYSDVLAQLWVESFHDQTNYENGKIMPLFSRVGAVGVSQVMQTAIDDLKQKGILDIYGKEWDFNLAITDPEYNIAAGIAYRKIIKENYLIPYEIEPNLYNVEFMYLVGVTYGRQILQKYGHNPHDYIDSLESIIGKSRADDVKYYYAFTDMFIELSENIKWCSSSYDITITDANGELLGMDVYQGENKNVYAMLDGDVTVAGEKPNNHGSMANGTWVKVESNVNKNYGNFQIAYIQLDEDSLLVKEGDKVKAGQKIGEAKEEFGVYPTYGDVKSQNRPGAMGYYLNLFSLLAKDYARLVADNKEAYILKQ